MSDKSASATAITQYRKLSFRTKLQEYRPVIVLFLMSVLLGFLAASLVPLFFSFVGHSILLPVCFVAGLFLAVGMVFAARFIDRKLLGAVKSGIINVEDRIIAGDTSSQMEDFGKLVAGYLKLKRMDAADYYSKKLLELSKSGGNSVMKLNDWLVTTECWVSSQAYHEGWHYKLVWLFETRGILTLGPNRLDFESKKIRFSCNPSNIVSIELKRHPIWLKPIPFRYISLTIDEMGQRHTFFLTPSFAQTDTVWDCNSMVDIWFQRLQKIKNSLNPAGAFPDWLKDVQG